MRHQAGRGQPRAPSGRAAAPKAGRASPRRAASAAPAGTARTGPPSPRAPSARGEIVASPGVPLVPPGISPSASRQPVQLAAQGGIASGARRVGGEQRRQVGADRRVDPALQPDAQTARAGRRRGIRCPASARADASPARPGRKRAIACAVPLDAMIRGQAEGAVAGALPAAFTRRGISSRSARRAARCTTGVSVAHGWPGRG